MMNAVQHTVRLYHAMQGQVVIHSMADLHNVLHVTHHLLLHSWPMLLLWPRHCKLAFAFFGHSVLFGDVTQHVGDIAEYEVGLLQQQC